MVASTSSHAFDGHRKGFVLGFGAGLGMTSFTQTLGAGSLSATSDRENKAGLATDFRIGGGFNEQFLLYYVNRASWISLENVFGNSVTIVSSVGLLGATYYFQSASPSPYVHGLLGLSSWDAPFESDTDALTGLGFGGGVGYEFSPHWSIEGSLNYSRPSKTVQGIEVSTDATSLQITVNGLAF
jgi:opacity protein-like surface antigen